jgi:Asp-tRNA(Asn)/Glu-tRNA(Gln) amidotransferase A subunit family amidase
MMRGSWGPMARCVDDLTTLLDLMIEGSEPDTTISYVPFNHEIYNDRSTKLRIGITWTDQFLDPPATCKRALTIAAEALKI